MPRAIRLEAESCVRGEKIPAGPCPAKPHTFPPPPALEVLHRAFTTRDPVLRELPPASESRDPALRQLPRASPSRRPVLQELPDASTSPTPALGELSGGSNDRLESVERSKCDLRARGESTALETRTPHHPTVPERSRPRWQRPSDIVERSATDVETSTRASITAQAFASSRWEPAREWPAPRAPRGAQSAFLLAASTSVAGAVFSGSNTALSSRVSELRISSSIPRRPFTTRSMLR
jgi:hypothetical protein